MVSERNYAVIGERKTKKLHFLASGRFDTHVGCSLLGPDPIL